MTKRNLFRMMMFVSLLMSAVVLNAQQSQSGSKSQSQGMRMDNSSMDQIMDQIASDKSMRKEMMTKIMDEMKDDTTAMVETCREMMNNPEMRKVMTKMMNKEGLGGGGMMRGDMKGVDVESETGVGVGHETGDTVNMALPHTH